MIERNLDQMIKVLHLRLASISEAAQQRKEYCIHDLKPNSRMQSSQLPNIAADYDDFNTNKSSVAKETNKNVYTGHNKELNLVSTEGVFVDPAKLGGCNNKNKNIFV